MLPPRQCPNKNKVAHGAKLKLNYRGACVDCGKQITNPPLMRRLSSAAAIARTVNLYNGAPE